MSMHSPRRRPLGVSVKAIKLGLGLLAALVGSLVSLYHPNQAPRSAVADGAYHQVAYVHDGDTIRLDDGQRVRLIGVDAPESHENEKLARDVARRHVDALTQLAMGQQAARYAKSLLSGQRVRLVFDVDERDRYGRLLAYVYLPDGTFVNEKLIREGYAYPLTIPPNVRHAGEFKQWFDEAREQRRGLWAQE